MLACACLACSSASSCGSEACSVAPAVRRTLLCGITVTSCSLSSSGVSGSSWLLADTVGVLDVGVVRVKASCSFCCLNSRRLFLLRWFLLSYRSEVVSVFSSSESTNSKRGATCSGPCMFSPGLTALLLFCEALWSDSSARMRAAGSDSSWGEVISHTRVGRGSSSRCRSSASLRTGSGFEAKGLSTCTESLQRYSPNHVLDLCHGEPHLCICEVLSWMLLLQLRD